MKTLNINTVRSETCALIDEAKSAIKADEVKVDGEYVRRYEATAFSTKTGEFFHLRTYARNFKDAFVDFMGQVDTVNSFGSVNATLVEIHIDGWWTNE